LTANGDIEARHDAIGDTNLSVMYGVLVDLTRACRADVEQLIAVVDERY